MVVIKEASGMFWGVTLDTGKRYTQTVERSFHISMAALEPKQGSAANQNVCVMLQHDKADYLMCTLSQSRLFQQELDLNFTEGEEVTFYLSGTGTVHLTGYLMDDGEMDDGMDGQFDTTGEFSDEDDVTAEDDESFDEDDSDGDEAPELSTTFGDLETTQSTDEEDEDWSDARKRKLKQALKAAKKVRNEMTKQKPGEQDDEEDDEEDDDSMDDSMEAMGTTMESFDTSQFSDSDDSDMEDLDEEEETPTKKSKQDKKQSIKQTGKVPDSGGKKKAGDNKPKSQPPSTKKLKIEQKGQTPKSAAVVKQEQKTPKSDVKKGGDKVKVKSEQQTPSGQKGDKAKTPKSEKTVPNGAQNNSPGDSSPNLTPGGSKASRKRKRQREKRASLLVEEKKE